MITILAKVLEDFLCNNEPAVIEAAEALVGAVEGIGDIHLAQTGATVLSLILPQERTTLSISKDVTRMLLARFHVISTVSTSPYGGDLSFMLEGRRSVRGQFKNTPDEQFVRLFADRSR